MPLPVVYDNIFLNNTNKLMPRLMLLEIKLKHRRVSRWAVERIKHHHQYHKRIMLILRIKIVPLPFHSALNPEWFPNYQAVCVCVCVLNRSKYTFSFFHSISNNLLRGDDEKANIYECFGMHLIFIASSTEHFPHQTRYELWVMNINIERRMGK